MNKFQSKSKVYLSENKNEFEIFTCIRLDMKKQDWGTLVNFNEIKLKLESNNLAEIHPFNFINKIKYKKRSATGMNKF